MPQSAVKGECADPPHRSPPRHTPQLMHGAHQVGRVGAGGAHRGGSSSSSVRSRPADGPLRPMFTETGKDSKNQVTTTSRDVLLEAGPGGRTRAPRAVESSESSQLARRWEAGWLSGSRGRVAPAGPMTRSHARATIMAPFDFRINMSSKAQYQPAIRLSADATLEFPSSAMARSWSLPTPRRRSSAATLTATPNASISVSSVSGRGIENGCLRKAWASDAC